MSRLSHSHDVESIVAWWTKTLEQHEFGHMPFLIATELNTVITIIKLKYQMYRNRKLHPLLGWMLPKIRIIPKKASNKSFSASNFGQKSPQGHMSIFPKSRAPSKDEMVEKSEGIFLFLYKLILKPYHLSSPLAPLGGGGEIGNYPRRLFGPKFYSKKLLFEPFFGILPIFGSVQPKRECIFPFLYNLIFKPYHLSSPLAPLWEVIGICPRAFFCPKFDPEKLLFEAFFGIVHILTTVRYYRTNKWNTDSLFTTRAIKNGVCLHLCCSSALGEPETDPNLAPDVAGKWLFKTKIGIRVPFFQAKGYFSRSHTWFVYIQFLITISSPFTPWSKVVTVTYIIPLYTPEVR